MTSSPSSQPHHDGSTAMASKRIGLGFVLAVIAVQFAEQLAWRLLTKVGLDTSVEHQVSGDLTFWALRTAAEFWSVMLLMLLVKALVVRALWNRLMSPTLRAGQIRYVESLAVCVVLALL